ncbi:Hpt domain-containing protein [Marivita sp. GX14005]|uniref:Hpt domain-containing protein n=1 Tax=Marivita sp. GX14005 TaxID=2942276 RepID=UPI0020185768|nr:Hpt domain-containing protein [Marivita sp. GX14005]MCL3883908.1 Hpt domain-containing protein [Marivita sp. GX14005]
MRADACITRTAETAISALRRRFLDDLEFRLADIDRAAQDCRRPENPEAFARLAGLCHKLAGVAASFGFPQLGEEARAVELGANALSGAPSQQARDAVLARAEHLLDLMEDILETPQPEVPRR